MFARIFEKIHQFLSKDSRDMYLHIGTTREILDKTEVVPFSRHAEVPYLGKDHSAMVCRAMRIYPNDTSGELRLKWLKAQFKMRSEKIDWIMQPMPGEVVKENHRNNKFTRFNKWGITSVGKSADVVQMQQKRA